MLKKDAIVHAILLLGLPLFGMLFAFVGKLVISKGPFLFFYLLGVAIGILILGLGWLKLLRAKWPEVKNLEFFKFGPAELSSEGKTIYAQGYAQISVGLAWLLIIAITLI
jgi:hypothetical protein